MYPGGGRLIVETAHVVLDATDTHGWERAVPGDHVRITVTDTGTGMSPDVLAHAFEPFFTTKPIGQGTGLGLSQLYGFVQQSGGIVRLESAPGPGTSVHLYLPRAHDTVTDTQKPVPTEARQPPLPAVFAATVLLVEDEDLVRVFAADALRERGYRVLEASDGPTGLNALHQALRDPAAGGVDLLVTDVGLPGWLNGRQLADAARAMVPDLPVLLITGYAGDAINGPGRLDQGMEMLGKPFELEILSSRVRALIERAKTV
jgi:CheY-like chemotaxis protein